MVIRIVVVVKVLRWGLVLVLLLSIVWVWILIVFVIVSIGGIIVVYRVIVVCSRRLSLSFSVSGLLIRIKVV